MSKLIDVVTPIRDLEYRRGPISGCAEHKRLTKLRLLDITSINNSN